MFCSGEAATKIRSKLAVGDGTEIVTTTSIKLSSSYVKTKKRKEESPVVINLGEYEMTLGKLDL